MARKAILILLILFSIYFILVSIFEDKVAFPSKQSKQKTLIEKPTYNADTLSPNLIRELEDIHQESIQEKKNQNSESQDKRRSVLQKYCQRVQQSVNKRRLHYGDGFLFNFQQKVIYCRVPKVACSTWKRVFLMFEGFQRSLNEIHMNEVHRFPLKYLDHLNDKALASTKSYYSFMFSRHPHDRLFSAYRNKFLNPRGRTAYLIWLGPRMVYENLTNDKDSKTFMEKHHKGSKLLKVTFKQFVKFVLKNPPNYDAHWQPQTDICKPCHFTFSHLGKFETLNEDSKTIFDDIKRPDVFKMFKSGDDTVYTKKTTELMRKHYNTLPKDMIRKINEYYKDDFEAFGYDPHYYLGEIGL